MIHTIRVSLTREGVLCINTRDNPHVFTAPGTIRLKLVGNRLTQGKFEPVGHKTTPGFAWISNTANARFGEPVVVAGRMIDIANQHEGPATRGCWIFQINVGVRNKVFSTTYTQTSCTDQGDNHDCDDDPDCNGDEACCRLKLRRVKNNPVIINR